MRVTKKRETMSNVEEGLAELSGVAVCAAPGCSIVLKGTQGKYTDTGITRVRTCFQVRCVDWATREEKKS